MTKAYKQPEEILVEEFSMSKAKNLKEIQGMFETMLSTSAPTGKPTKFVDQFKLVLNELSPVASSALTTGQLYKITTVGTSDFTQVGATKSELNVYFVATGTTAGTGSATAYDLRLYVYSSLFGIWRYVTLSM